MPEGPEVKIMADGLRSYIVGLYINNIVVTHASRYYKTGLKNLEITPFPLLVCEVVSKGKKIIIDCQTMDGVHIYLISALGMEGSWRLNGGKHAWIEVYAGERILYFHDTRHFGTFNICHTQEEVNFVLKDVGPDLLSESVSFEDYDSVISRSKLGHKEVCWFMMEQKYFSGVGNYLLAEILYASRILPTRSLSSLSYEEKYSLWYNSVNLIREAYEQGGLTIATYRSMNGDKGIFETKVYGKSYDPLGNPVYRETFSNGRTSHYCPNVQF